MLPGWLRERYNKVAAGYRRRRWKVPELPEDIHKASNVVREMVAKINNRPPLRVVYSDKPANKIADE